MLRDCFDHSLYTQVFSKLFRGSLANLRRVCPWAFLFFAATERFLSNTEQSVFLFLFSRRLTSQLPSAHLQVPASYFEDMETIIFNFSEKLFFWWFYSFVPDLFWQLSILVWCCETIPSRLFSHDITPLSGHGRSRSAFNPCMVLFGCLLSVWIDDLYLSPPPKKRWVAMRCLTATIEAWLEEQSPPFAV